MSVCIHVCEHLSINVCVLGGRLHYYLFSLFLEVSQQHPGGCAPYLNRLTGQHVRTVLQSELDESGFKCQACRLLALGPYTSHLTSFYLSFLSFKMQIILLHRICERRKQGLSCEYIHIYPLPSL